MTMDAVKIKKCSKFMSQLETVRLDPMDECTVIL
jgi:hypothetical protein